MCGDGEKFDIINSEYGTLKQASDQHVTEIKSKGKTTIRVKDGHYDINNALIKKSSGKIVLKANRKNDLYYMSFDEIEKANAVEDTNIMKWHKRFGHLNEFDLKAASKKSILLY